MGGEGVGKERGRAEKGGRWEDRGKKGGGINLLHGGLVSKLWQHCLLLNSLIAISRLKH